MSLKSIRESYSKLLTTFNDAGIKLSDNQKQDVDSFVLAVESTMSKQRESAIRKTKKAVTRKLEKEFREVFESIMKSTSENNILASKIQDLSNRLVESKKIAKSVDKYLNLYVESVLPKKTVIDYDRMQKLETIQESLKDLLVIDEAAVKQKQAKLDESFKSAKSKCETKVAKMQVKLNESNNKIKSLQKELSKLEAVKLLEAKTKNLPDFEARSVKKRLAEASKEEISKNFKRVLETVQEEAKKAIDENELALDEEIDSIIKNDDIKENDMLRGRKHNIHVDEADRTDDLLAAQTDATEVEYDVIYADSNGKKIPTKIAATSISEMIASIEDYGTAIDHFEQVIEDGEDITEEANSVLNSLSEKEEEFETMESVKFDECGNVDLDEDDVIDENLMRAWCNQSIEVK